MKNLWCSKSPEKNILTGVWYKCPVCKQGQTAIVNKRVYDLDHFLELLLPTRIFISCAKN
jgi:hypothetical protein